MRDFARLAETPYDAVIIGGGIYGLFTAWDASLRGLAVALVEKGDFGHATSSKTLRVIHGGLRYLQTGDLRRMRESVRERTIMMRIAPHLVHPLPVLIPTYGHGMRGKHALSVALKVHDLVGFDRNRLDDPSKSLPPSQSLSREECLRLFAGLEDPGLTGAGTYHDCQMYSSERLILSVFRSAVKAGAQLANYVEATGFISEGSRLAGVRALDLPTGDPVDIRAGIVINCAGPWTEHVSGLSSGTPRRLAFSKAFNLLVRKELTTEYALGVYSKATPGKKSRMFFINPRPDGCLIGTEHLPYDGEADELEVTEGEIQSFLAEVNEAYPPAHLSRDDVLCVYAGLLPADAYADGEVQLTRRFRISDEGVQGGPEGLISVIGVKFTESRHVAEKTVDLIFEKLGKSPPRCVTGVTPLHGGEIGRFAPFLAEARRSRPPALSSQAITHLVNRYGSAYPEILAYLDDEALSVDEELGSEQTLKAEVIHGIRDEMALKLSDIVFRRTALGVGGVPADEALQSCAAIAGAELGWSESVTREELEEVRARSSRSANTQALVY